MILSCKNCFATTQIHHEKPNFNSPKYIKFCPICGSNNTSVAQDDDEETWFCIAQAIEGSVETTKQLYKLWDPRSGDNKNFVSWINDMRKEKS